MLSKKSPSTVRYTIIIIVMMVIGAVGMFGIAKHKQTSYYTADRAMVISHAIHEEKNSDNDFNSDDQQMMATYKKIAEDPVIAKAARRYLPHKFKKEYSADDLNKDVSVKVSPQSLILTMESKTSNKTAAVETVNAMSKAMKKKLPSIQPGAGDVRLLSPATSKEVSTVTAPHVKKYVAVGLALGAMIGFIICFVKETWTRLL